MNFCETCGNMLYMNVRPGDDGVPVLSCACKSCGSSSELGAEKCSAALFTSDYSDDHLAYKQYMSPHISHDPTLPHADNIECINPDCSRQTEEPRDVIFVKYDRKNLKFLYHCCYCKEFWKSS